jgi:hypothetical protein
MQPLGETSTSIFPPIIQHPKTIWRLFDLQRLTAEQAAPDAPTKMCDKTHCGHREAVDDRADWHYAGSSGNASNLSRMQAIV